MPDRDHVFTAELFRFLVELQLNNNREWFGANKARYEEHVKHPLAAFAAALAPRLAKIAPGYGQAKVFRVHRDTRFSKDKTPYKTQAAAQFLRTSAGSDVHQPGFYVHLEPGECFVAAGIWMPDAATLARIRAAIIAKPAAWAPLAKLEFWGESYARPPKGVDPGHRFVADLMRKHYLTWVDLADEQVLGPAFLGRVEKACARMAPLVTFLDRALGIGERGRGGRRRRR
jgi:uncharacterized protein (TIGR02453 family)